MIPAPFDYLRPASVDEALRLLATGAGEAKLLAGGQSLLPLLKLGLGDVGRLIDIGRLADLRGVRSLADGGVAIGALTTYRDLLDAAAIAQRYPLLAEGVERIADVQVRNRGTVGGALAHADPASDLPALVLALDARLVLRSVRGERVLDATAFFRGPFTTAAERDELLTELRLPPLPEGAGTAYRNLEQPASGYSIVGVAAVVSRSGGRIGHARVALTGVSDVAYRATGVEASLVGSDGSGAAIAAAAAKATEGHSVGADIHADSDYRAAMAVVHVRRAVTAALERAG